MGKRAVVAASGGVDSLGAILRLKKAGFDVVALHARLAEKKAEERDLLETALAAACHALHVPLEIVDLRERFMAEIMEPFRADYAGGLTPNPCALCNRKIKFGALMDYAMECGADFYATGHYVNLVPNPYSDGVLPGSARDAQKDQAYFLAHVPACRLTRLLFPCADLLKSEIREMVQSHGLSVPEPLESQDACFTGGNWRKLVEGASAPENQGPILLKYGDGSLKKIGSHSGLWQFTRGQRRRLCLPASEALYVLEKCQTSNELVVGPARFLFMTACRAGQINFFAPFQSWPQNLWIKTRFRQQAQKAKVNMEKGDLLVELCEPAFPGSEGQTLAVYDASGRLLAGAVINAVFMAQ